MHKFQVLRLGLKTICAVPASIEYHRFFGWYYWMLCRSGTTLIVWGTGPDASATGWRGRTDEVRAATEARYLLARRKGSRNCNTKRLPLRIRPSEIVRVAVLGLALPRCRSDNPHFNGVSVILWLKLTHKQRQASSSARRRNLFLQLTLTSSFCGVISFQVRS